MFEGEKIQLWQLCDEQGTFTYQFEIKTKMLKTEESLLIRNPVGDVVFYSGIWSRRRRAKQTVFRLFT
jgi:hypothetical protein